MTEAGLAFKKPYMEWASFKSPECLIDQVTYPYSL